jgi:hypothetical protein
MALRNQVRRNLKSRPFIVDANVIGGKARWWSAINENKRYLPLPQRLQSWKALRTTNTPQNEPAQIFVVCHPHEER